MVLVGGVTEVRGKVFAFMVQGAPNQGDTEAGSGLWHSQQVGGHLLEPGASNTGTETGKLVHRDQRQWCSS